MEARTSRYHEVYARWQRDPEGFWAQAARDIDWYRARRRSVFDPQAGRLRPLVSGRGLQHLLQRGRPPRRATGAASQAAIIYDSPLAGRSAHHL